MVYIQQVEQNLAQERGVHMITRGKRSSDYKIIWAEPACFVQIPLKTGPFQYWRMRNILSSRGNTNYKNMTDPSSQTY